MQSFLGRPKRGQCLEWFFTLSKLQASDALQFDKAWQNREIRSLWARLGFLCVMGSVCVALKRGVKGEHKKIQVVSKLIHFVSKTIHHKLEELYHW